MARKKKNFVAQYLVGCDGAFSLVRSLAGIKQKLDEHRKRMVLTVVRSPQMSALINEQFSNKSFFNVKTINYGYCFSGEKYCRAPS